MQKIFKETKGNNLSESLQAHLLKMPTTIVNLALIFELTEGGVLKSIKMLFRQHCVGKNIC